MDRETTRVTSGVSRHAVSPSRDKRGSDIFHRSQAECTEDRGSRVQDFWMHALSPSGVLRLDRNSLRPGKDFRRRRSLWHCLPWGPGGVSRPLCAADDVWCPSGTTGLTLGPDAIWSVAPLVLVVIFARVFPAG